jgi:uncharacterized protein YciI
MSLFVVTSQQGPAWLPSKRMREQPEWDEHAAFVNAQVREGFIIAAGPLGGGPVHRALLIVSSASEESVRARFAGDPWIRTPILQILRVDPWEILASDDRLDRVLEAITRPAS